MFSLKFKIILLSIVPLIAVTSLIATLVLYQSQVLTNQQRSLLQDNILENKRAELRNHISQALASINEIYLDNSLDPNVAKHQAKQIINRLRFSNDGYFYIYTLEGVNLVHPINPELVGENLWDYQDSQGTFLIQDLIAQAKAGGGYSTYLWEKPSTGELERKLGVVTLLDKWQWMLGTGVYLDEIDRVVSKLDLQMEANIERTFSWIFFVCTTAMVLIGVLGASLNISEHKLADKKLKQLTKRIIDSQEQERTRVSRELHDGINQLLVSIKYRLETATECEGTSEVVTESLQHGLSTINEAIGEIRRISRDLRPSILDDLGLHAALNSLCQEFEQRTGIDLFFESNIENLELSETVETTLYRVTQEALQNIEKHSKADTIDIHLQASPKQLKMSIQDNGCGFDAHKARRRKELSPHGNGFGLRNIRERIAFIDGIVEVKSQVGQGTQLKVQVPLTIHGTNQALAQPIMEAQ
ncbi:histidine kinase [Alginatibacterium sediminis]|uniref:Oxygen sensor histidine kinase NreB n=1 Tax=Alginatibacterium sediminis TaxID=2164068 RepID=A0A420E7Z6_9ALTE|nr:cache domain-containing protein [Alginatibacterium sediminis]RKF14293.1 histidine kinase [Alginatibacterium sediminis]